MTSKLHIAFLLFAMFAIGAEMITTPLISPFEAWVKIALYGALPLLCVPQYRRMIDTLRRARADGISLKAAWAAANVLFWTAIISSPVLFHFLVVTPFARDYLAMAGRHGGFFTLSIASDRLMFCELMMAGAIVRVSGYDLIEAGAGVSR